MLVVAGAVRVPPCRALPLMPHMTARSEEFGSPLYITAMSAPGEVGNP